MTVTQSFVSRPRPGHIEKVIESSAEVKRLSEPYGAPDVRLYMLLPAGPYSGHYATNFGFGSFDDLAAWTHAFIAGGSPEAADYGVRSRGPDEPELIDSRITMHVGGSEVAYRSPVLMAMSGSMLTGDPGELVGIAEEVDEIVRRLGAAGAGIGVQYLAGPEPGSCTQVLGFADHKAHGAFMAKAQDDAAILDLRKRAAAGSLPMTITSTALLTEIPLG